MSKKEKGELIKLLTEKKEKLEAKKLKYIKRFLKAGLTEKEISDILS